VRASWHTTTRWMRSIASSVNCARSPVTDRPLDQVLDRRKRNLQMSETPSLAEQRGNFAGSHSSGEPPKDFTGVEAETADHDRPLAGAIG